MLFLNNKSKPEPVLSLMWEAVVAQNPPPSVSLLERKTGVKDAEVITSRIVQDERGWLRLAG